MQMSYAAWKPWITLLPILRPHLLFCILTASSSILYQTAERKGVIESCKELIRHAVLSYHSGSVHILIALAVRWYCILVQSIRFCVDISSILGQPYKYQSQINRLLKHNATRCLELWRTQHTNCTSAWKASRVQFELSCKVKVNTSSAKYPTSSKSMGILFFKFVAPSSVWAKYVEPVVFALQLLLAASMSA